MMSPNLYRALWNRTDIATLRAQFEIPDDGSILFASRKDDESIETFFPWLVEVLCWLNSNATDKSKVFYNICSHASYLSRDSACLVDFFLRWCAPVNQATLDRCLRHHIIYGFKRVAQRLLDAGAHLILHAHPMISQSCYDRWLMIHDHRLATRAISRAVLHVAERRETRHGIPRDVWRIVAKMVWSKRF